MNNMERIKAESEDLLKCPFCGGEARLIRYARKKYGKDEYIVGTAVCCGVCEARIFFRSEALAIESWNRRADDSQNKAQLATENYNIGYVEGYEQGKECGYDKGYNAGYNEGLNEGYEMAKRLEGTEGNG